MSLPAKKLAALFKMNPSESRVNGNGNGKPAAPPPAPLSPLEAVRLATRSASTEELCRKGIEKIRLLSEAKLEEIIAGMVEARVEERLAAQRQAGSSLLAPPAAPVEDSDLKRRLRSEYEKKWQEFQASQNSKFKSLEERVEKVKDSFLAMESTVEHLLRSTP